MFCLYYNYIRMIFKEKSLKLCGLWSAKTPCLSIFIFQALPITTERKCRMLQLIKYLKKSIVPIIFIFILLIIQAVSDLSLPEYTSNIVNVGIQQGGIEEVTPKKIRKEQLEMLFAFMSKDQIATVEASYNLVGDVYELTATDTAVLDTIFPLPIFISLQMKNQAATETGTSQQMPDMETLKEKMKDVPESIVNQSAIGFIKDEYNAVGINTEKMQSNYILVAGLKMLGLALLSMVATIAVGFLSAKVAARTGRDLRSNVFSKVLSFSNTELDKFSTASLITRSTNDIQQIQMLSVMLLRVVFYAPIMGVGGVLKVLNTNTSMAWIIAVAVVAILTLVVTLFGIAIPKFNLVQKLIDKLNLVTREILTGIPVIRAFSNQKHEEKRFDEANASLTKTNLFVNRIMTVMMPSMMLIMNLITILIVWSGAKSVDLGAMQVGDLMAFIQYAMQIIMSFLMISMLSIMLPRAAVSAKRIDEVLTTTPIIHDPKNAKKFKTLKKGYIEFRNVTFRYPNAEEDVLSDISFIANPGQTTAFIGSTGSGKSTLINLIPRFYDASAGEILIDGVNIQSVSQHDLRDKLGLVPQKGVLFSGTIESNIKYGKNDISDEDMEKAARISQSSAFINDKDEKFDSPISQGGSNVSGGQKQRLAIARAIASKPEIYIFDDSFSALDFKTDIALRRALKSETGESTVLIVAQRISTIIQAEQIIVLDEGRIVGMGTHKELLTSCEVYNQIALSQLSKEELA